jgi:hypothetical protein
MSPLFRRRSLHNAASPRRTAVAGALLAIALAAGAAVFTPRETPATPASVAMAADVFAADAVVEMPDWLKNDMTRLVAAGDRWITDNGAYRSVNEPADAYGLEWQWGLGNQSVTGRLFGLASGREIGTYWQFRIYWHAGRREAVALQWGVDGTVGEGTSRQTGNGDEIEMIQTFTGPDGSSSRTRHLATTTETVHDTRSFDFADGQWKPRRNYVWHRRPR